MTWLRSGNENNYNNAYVLSTSGVYNNNNVTNDPKFRDKLEMTENIVQNAKK